MDKKLCLFLYQELQSLRKVDNITRHFYVWLHNNLSGNMDRSALCDPRKGVIETDNQNPP